MLGFTEGLEEFFENIAKITAAVEKLAAIPIKAEPEPIVSTKVKPKPPVAQAEAVDYSFWSLEALKEECAKRSIGIKPRSKVPTYIAALKADDAKGGIVITEQKSVEVEERDFFEEVSKEKEEAAQAVKDTFGPTEDDPFSELEEKPKKRGVTKEQLIERLQKLRADCERTKEGTGNTVVAKLILKIGKVEKLSQVSEDKYAELYEAAENYEV